MVDCCTGVDHGGPICLSIVYAPDVGGVVSASIFGVLTMFFMGYFVFSIRFIVAGDELLIKSGFVKFKPVAIPSIRRIEATRSILSSPAASLDRLEIIYNRYDSVIVSPEDKAGFIEDLRAINPAIEIK